MLLTALTLVMRASLILVVLAGGIFRSAHAATYDFKIVGGQRVFDVGSNICIDVMQRSPTTVTFTLSAKLPDPVSSIVTVAIDTGQHSSMFTDISVLMQSPGGTMKKSRLSGHAYLPGFTPDYAFAKDGSALYHAGGLNTGDVLMLSATLASGKTFADVLTAFNQGLNPSTQAAGLRVGVIAHHLKGKRRNPNVTEGDDAGFATRAVSSHCQGR